VPIDKEREDMMDPMWYMAYVPVFLIGVLAGYASGRVTGEREVRETRAAKNKKCPWSNCPHRVVCHRASQCIGWKWPHN
jgi:hypothetical protein